MNSFLSDLFLKIANKLGFELQSKQYVVNDFYDTNDISITSIMADRLATLIVADSDVEVTGSKNAEEVLGKIAEKYFNSKLKVSVVAALGTGDCLIVPVTNGKAYDIDIIENDNFAIINSIGDTFYSVVMKRDEVSKNNNIYRRFELHSLEEVDGIQICRIYRYAYKNDVEIPMSTITEWENIPIETIIPNVDRLLFGRIKCPTINRDNLNSAQGVPITYGLDIAVQKAKESYMRFNSEYENKETMIFAGKQLFTKDKDNNIVLPRKGVFQMVRTDMEGNLPIKEFSPDLRYNDLKGGVDFNFKMLELFCGLSSGILSETESSFATATEIRASMQGTFAYINVMRKMIDNAMNDLIYAISMLYNANSSNGVLGDWEVGISWDDSMLENSTEMFNMLLQANGIGEIKKGEIRSWLLNISKDQAESDLEEVDTTVSNIV